jgi:hypothetical protein
VQIVGMNTLKEIAEDPMLSGRTLPTRCRCWRSAWRAWLDDARLSTGGCGPRIRRRPGSLLRNAARPSSESKQDRNPRRTALFGFRRRTVQYV